MTRYKLALLFLSWTCLLLGSSPLAAQMSVDGLFNGFVPSGDFIFELDGEQLVNAQIYHSDRAVAYLIMAPELSSPLLINPRTRWVESVHLMKVAKRDDGSIDLLDDATFDIVDRFQIEGMEIVFNYKDQLAKLKPKPWLLGLRPGTARQQP